MWLNEDSLKYEKVFYEIQASLGLDKKDSHSVRTTVSLSSVTQGFMKDKGKIVAPDAVRKTQKAMIDYMLDSFINAYEENIPIHYLPKIERHRLENPVKKTIVMTQKSLRIASAIANNLGVTRDVVIDFVLNKHCQIHLDKDQEMNDEISSALKLATGLLAKIEESNLFLLHSEFLDDGREGITNGFAELVIAADILKQRIEARFPEFAKSN